MGTHKPEVWVSDLYSSQAKHPAVQWQVCLAHQLRDCKYAIDVGDNCSQKVLRAFTQAKNEVESSLPISM